MDNPTIIGITMGDPASIGPEITVKALADKAVYQMCRPLVVGDAQVLEAAKKLVGHEELIVRAVTDVADAAFSYGTIDVLDLGMVSMDKLVRGQISAMCGDAAFRYVEKVIELAMNGQVDATVTNAFNKEAVNLAGHHYSGHTEIYGELTGTRNYTMMLAHENLRVVHVSTHVSLREACDRVKKDRVLDCIHIANNACKALGIKAPKIGVAGLNPHCGENGMFGTEEVEEIQPAIDAALSEGIDIPERKPTPPDTVFSKALGGWYDIVVVMYHDQGHIPLKVKGFVYNKEEKHWEAVAGVNVTLGLPIIRASVDHGTGYGHAGSGHANELSLGNAISYAIQLAENR